jgi:hypothetical protein
VRPRGTINQEASRTPVAIPIIDNEVRPAVGRRDRPAAQIAVITSREQDRRDDDVKHPG